MNTENSYWTGAERRRLARRRLLSGAAAAGAGLAGLSLVGCGDDDDDGQTTPVASDTSSSTPDAGKPKAGGIYRWNYITQVPSLVDPYVVGSVPHMWIYAGNNAVRWDATGSKLIPELYGSWESVDGVDHVVTVRPNVKTHNVPLTNGRLLDAEDIAANLMHMSGLADPANAEKYSARGVVPGLLSAKAVDATHVQVKFAKPTPSFPAGLTNHNYAILPRENYADPQTLSNAMRTSGTGPWIISEYKLNESYSFKPNPDYWNGGPPHFEGMVIRPAGDRLSEMSSFIQGDEHYFNNPSKVERETIEKSVKGSQLFQWPGSTCAYMIFNVRKAPFNDVRVRQALHLATNYVKNQDAYWGSDFYTLGGVVNNAFAVGLSQDELLKRPGWRPDKSADLKTANELLTAAGFPQGRGLSVQYLTSGDAPPGPAYGPDFAIRQMDDWRQAFPNIDVTTSLLADTTGFRTRQREGDFQVTHSPRVSIGPAAVDMAEVFTTQGVGNLSGYSNSQVDNLLARAISTLDSAEADDLVKKAQDIVLEEMPALILHRIHQACIFAANVKGFPTIPGGTRPLAGSFENWNSVTRHTAVLWFE